MTLNDYILNGPSVVIADDDRDPYVSWQHHLERTANDAGGPRGGVDLVASVGTPVYAPTDGTLVRMPNDGGAGNSTRFWHDKNIGWADVFSHLSSYVYSPRGDNWYRQGELIAYSGDTGGVTQHLHRHLLDPNNVRRNPWDYFSESSTSGNGDLIIIEIGENMDKVVLIMRKDDNYSAEWSLVGATVPGGYRKTSSQKTANAWASIYGNVSTQNMLKRDDYVKVQQEAVALNQSWLTQAMAIAGK